VPLQSFRDFADRGPIRFSAFSTTHPTPASYVHEPCVYLLLLALVKSVRVRRNLVATTASSSINHVGTPAGRCCDPILRALLDRALYTVVCSPLSACRVLGVELHHPPIGGPTFCRERRRRIPIHVAGSYELDNPSGCGGESFALARC
jgi:hypothetical protein